MKPIRPAFVLLSFYGLWVGASWGVQMSSRFLPSTGQWYPVWFVAAVAGFVLLGCLLNTLFLVYADPWFHRHPGIRGGCLLFSLAAAGLMYLLAQHWLIKTPLFYMVYTANLLVLANLLGSWLVSPLQRQAELVLVCLVMTLADLFSIIRGPTHSFIKTIQVYYESGLAGPPPGADFLLVKIPLPGLNHLQPLFGVSDWIILVFLSGAAAKFHINDNLAGKGLAAMTADRRAGVYVPVAAVALLIAIFAAGLLNRFIPALPVIAVLFVAFILFRYSSARQLLWSDWLLMIAFTAVMLSLLGLGLALTT